LGASGLDGDEIKISINNINAAALATSSLTRLRNSNLSSLHYRISTILFHSGARFEDLIRLNRLGVCMSPNAMLRLQNKMGKQLEGKIHVWKKTIEENRGTLLFAEELKKRQVPAFRDESDMDICEDVETNKDTVKMYSFFTEESYASFQKISESVRKERNEEDISVECLNEIINSLKKTRLPFYKQVYIMYTAILLPLQL